MNLFFRDDLPNFFELYQLLQIESMAQAGGVLILMQLSWKTTNFFYENNNVKFKQSCLSR